MSRTFDLAYILLMVSLLIFLVGDAYIGYKEHAWRQRCEDAGGVSVSHFVCVNPGAVIEVE